MKLSQDFEFARLRVKQDEETMNELLDTVVNKKSLNKGTKSDKFLQKHFQHVANLYMSFYGNLDMVYTTPLTKEQESYVKTHAGNLKNAFSGLADTLEQLDDDYGSGHVDVNHQLSISKLYIGFNMLVEGHESLLKQFIEEVSANQQKRPGNKPSPE
jgi:hypothetical protein